MADLGSARTDAYALSMTYADPITRSPHLPPAVYRLSSLDRDGRWVNSVDQNHGGTTRFVPGPRDPSYGLGTYGFDPATHTAWAVLNYNGEFAVVQDLEPGHQGDRRD